jgi:hypothetical protein
MAQQLESLETTLDDVFRKNIKKAIIKYLPILNLVFGVLTLWSVTALWRWAHQSEQLVNWANDLARTYGGKQVSASRMASCSG